MKTILLVTVTIILLSNMSVEGLMECNPYFGPAGKAECVELEGYDDAQWGVCLSNEYIQIKSKYRHICREYLGMRPDYCWYQCQIETFNLEDGPVYDQCRCAPGDPPSTEPPIPHIQNGNGSLPEWCLSPSGTECNWYKDCLLKRHPCVTYTTGYAMSYSEKFCNLYKKFQKYRPTLIESQKYRSSITTQGLKWVDAVRKCLQVALVPYIRPWSKPTCGDLKKIAYNSHAPCYLEPLPDAPSICDLDCKDWAHIFWGIKDGFTQSFVEPLQGALDVMLGHCGKNFTLMTDECPTATVRLVLNRKAFRLGKRSSNQGRLNILAGNIADKLARKATWSKVNSDWYGYAPNSTTNQDTGSDIMEIEVLLADKVVLFPAYTAYRSPHGSNLRLKKEIKNLVDAVEDGYLYDMQIGNEKVSVKSMFACHDVQCEETFSNVTAGPPHRVNYDNDIYTPPENEGNP